MAGGALGTGLGFRGLGGIRWQVAHWEADFGVYRAYKLIRFVFC